MSRIDIVAIVGGGPSFTVDRVIVIATFGRYGFSHALTLIENRSAPTDHPQPPFSSLHQCEVFGDIPNSFPAPPSRYHIFVALLR